MPSSKPKVNKPTDIKEKEKDVNRKLQIYGIISAFKAGKVPSVGYTKSICSFVLETLTASCRTTKSMWL